MGCGYHGGKSRWQHKMERMQRKMDWMRAKMSGGAGLGSTRPRAATAPSTNIAPRRCGGSKKSSANSASSSTGCALPRTRPSSTSSWPSAATGPRRSEATAELIRRGDDLPLASRPPSRSGRPVAFRARPSHANDSLTTISAVRAAKPRPRPSLAKFRGDFVGRPVTGPCEFRETFGFGGARGGIVARAC